MPKPIDSTIAFLGTRNARLVVISTAIGGVGLSTVFMTIGTLAILSSQGMVLPGALSSLGSITTTGGIAFELGSIVALGTSGGVLASGMIKISHFEKKMSRLQPRLPEKTDETPSSEPSDIDSTTVVQQQVLDHLVFGKDFKTMLQNIVNCRDPNKFIFSLPHFNFFLRAGKKVTMKINEKTVVEGSKNGKRGLIIHLSGDEKIFMPGWTRAFLREVVTTRILSIYRNIEISDDTDTSRESEEYDFSMYFASL